MASEAGKGRKRKGLRKSADYTIFIITLALVALGVVMVYSASFYVAASREGDAHFYVKKQLIGMAIGLIAMIITMNFDYHNYAKLKWPIMIASVAVACLVWTPLGVELNGARRWISIPGLGSFQPSEFAKLGMILFLACEIALRPKSMQKFGGFIYILLLGGIFMIPVVLQKSLSVTIVMGATMIAIMFIAGAKIRYVGIVGGSVAAMGIALTFFSESGAFRLKRIAAYLDPWQDPTGTGYQLIQSLYSLGAGGWFGLGLGQSRQKYLFLPYSESDFIFAIIAEELGFVGAILVLAAFGFLIYRCIRVAICATDTLGTLLVGGISSLLAIQVIFHVLVVAGAIPPTGMPLPFISAGSSSLVIFMAAIGIVLNVSRYSRLKT